MPVNAAGWLMELRDWLAIAGLAYGVASDCIGESKNVQANSVSGLLWREMRKMLGRPSVAAVSAPQREPNFVKLIEDGWYHRSRLLRNPDVTDVEVMLMGDHLLLTVYKKALDDA